MTSLPFDYTLHLEEVVEVDKGAMCQCCVVVTRTSVRMGGQGVLGS
jgi:hypothetical protein